MNAGPSLHGGNPLSFFIENRKEYIETVADRGRWRRDETHAHHDMGAMPMDGLIPTNDIDAAGICPIDIGGDAWDYDSHEDVTITDRSVILTDSITVNHLVIGNGGRLIFGEPSQDEIKLRLVFKFMRPGKYKVPKSGRSGLQSPPVTSHVLKSENLKPTTGPFQ